jgi:hypothetical protein
VGRVSAPRIRHRTKAGIEPLAWHFYAQKATHAQAMRRDADEHEELRVLLQGEEITATDPSPEFRQ